MPVNHSSSMDKLLDYVPDLLEKTNCMMNKMMGTKKNCDKDKEKKECKNSDKSQKKNEDINVEFEYDASLEDE